MKLAWSVYIYISIRLNVMYAELEQNRGGFVWLHQGLLASTNPQPTDLHSVFHLLLPVQHRQPRPRCHEGRPSRRVAGGKTPSVAVQEDPWSDRACAFSRAGRAPIGSCFSILECLCFCVLASGCFLCIIYMTHHDTYCKCSFWSCHAILGPTN